MVRSLVVKTVTVLEMIVRCVGTHRVQLMANGVCGLHGAAVQRLVEKDKHNGIVTAQKTNLEGGTAPEVPFNIKTAMISRVQSMAFLTLGQTGRNAARLAVQGFSPEIERAMVHIITAKNAWGIILTLKNAIHIIALWTVFSWNGRLGQTAHCPVDQESRADPVYVSDLSMAEVDATALFKTTEPATITIVQLMEFGMTGVPGRTVMSHAVVEIRHVNARAQGHFTVVPHVTVLGMIHKSATRSHVPWMASGSLGVAGAHVT